MYLKLMADPPTMNREDPQPDEAARRSIVDASIRVAKMLGYSDAAGAIRGYLMLSDVPLSLDDLAEVTGYSKSTVSTNMAQLERMGIVRRVRRPGDKRHYYSTIISIDEGRKVHNEIFREIMQILAEGAEKGMEHLEAAGGGQEAERLIGRLGLIRDDCIGGQRFADLLDQFSIQELTEILAREVEGRNKGGK
ncbi:GbsR/MarR family transcriptional regulator [Candidatus Methanocrinis natronophilus]|uniref:HTH-type transcriptional regulator n=1 Tax=Candidatus Methanocrinis natronophilus TaxID=3033396 RepID=A0ABT5X4X4_9EURY|nr:MarR family transcriptional regulator [Candidatus Methanocrinis natronophilus]MDF0589754.1 MarR family transcriptional regulator [Candidatus Methanocrinis natronophilus]